MTDDAQKMLLQLCSTVQASLTAIVWSHVVLRIQIESKTRTKIDRSEIVDWTRGAFDIVLAALPGDNEIARALGDNLRQYVAADIDKVVDHVAAQLGPPPQPPPPHLKLV